MRTSFRDFWIATQAIYTTLGRKKAGNGWERTHELMKEGEEKIKRKKSTTMEEEIPTKAQRGEEGEQKSRRNRVNEVEWNVSELNMIYPICMKWSKEVERRLNFAAIPPHAEETFYDQRDFQERDTLTVDEPNQWMICKLKKHRWASSRANSLRFHFWTWWHNIKKLLCTWWRWRRSGEFFKIQCMLYCVF